VLTAEQSKLVEEYLPEARRYVSGMTNRARKCDQPDIEAAAALGLCQAAESWDGRGVFWGWAKRRVFGAVVDQNRQETHFRKRNLCVESVPDFKKMNLLLTDPFPEELMQLESALALLKKLPSFERLVIWLSFVEGLGHRKIAEETGKSVRYVRQSWCRALQTLRSSLSQTPVS
jgi:RNA polymerase sigma factor (sigma-70 family)